MAINKIKNKSKNEAGERRKFSFAQGLSRSSAWLGYACFLFIVPLLASASLYDYYGGKLPSIKERAKIYQNISPKKYTGSKKQNIFLENYLRLPKLGGILGDAGTATTTYADSISTLRGDTSLNNSVSLVASAIDTFQTNYIKSHTHYWQGLENPVIPPTYGSTTTLNPVIKPTYQTESWSSLSLDSVPFQIRVDQYIGGYNITFAVLKNGTVFHKGIGKGIKANYDWQ